MKKTNSIHSPSRRVHIHYDQPFRRYHATIARLIDKHTAYGGSMLDVGSGVGHMLSATADLRPDLVLTGVDVDPECLATTRQRVPGVDTALCDIDQAPPLGRTYDTVVLSHVLEHTFAPADVVRNLLDRVVAPRGALILAVPNPSRPDVALSNLWQRHYVNTGHVYAWDPSHWRVFLEVALGLEVAEYASDFVKVLPGRVIERSRRLGRLEVRLAQVFPWCAFSNIAVVRTDESDRAASIP